MDRRGFLQAGGAAAVAAGAAPARAEANLAGAGGAPRPAPSARARVLTLALAPGYDLAGFAADRLANRIAVATGGRFRLERADAAAACDLSFGDAHRLSALHPGFAFFAGLPRGAGLPSADLDAWLVFGGGQLLWDELAQPFGLKALVAGRIGEPAGLWSNVRLEQADDLVGLPVAAAGLAARVLSRLGATPIDVAPQHLRAALASGELGAAEWAGPLPAIAFDLGPVAQRLYQPGLNAGGALIVMSFARGLWHALSPADQAIFEACAAQEYRLQLAEAKFYASMAGARTAAKWPVRTGLPAPVVEALAAAGRAVVAELAGYDQSCRRIAASYEAYCRWRGVLA
jgi:TRAP-type mannitol/chloroaromatic compound transport system substrate-binding protein